MALSKKLLLCTRVLFLTLGLSSILFVESNSGGRLNSTADTSHPPISEPAANNLTDEEKLRNAVLSFTTAIYNAASCESSPVENILVSPFAISASLATVMVGSSKQELRSEFLQFSDSNDQWAHPMRHTLAQILGNQSERQFYALNFSTSLIVLADDDTTNVIYARPEYEAIAQEITGFQTKLQVLDRAQIHSKFSGSLDNASAGDIFLTNSVRFAAEWLDEFAVEEQNQTFYAAMSGSGPSTTLEPVFVQMLSKTGKFSLLRLSHAEIVELPYKNDEVSLIIILPTTRTGLWHFEKTLSAELLQAVEVGLRAATKQSVHITLPVFHVQSRLDMLRVMKRLGLNDSLAEAAQFDGIVGCETAGRNCLTNSTLKAFLHEAAFGLDEDGSDSFSFSSAVQISLDGDDNLQHLLSSIKSNADASIEVHEFRVDHPFMYYVRHNPTDIILLSGSVKQL